MSSLKLREFISQVKKYGMAKANHYFVELTMPPALQGLEPITSNLSTLALFCEQAEIPGINLDTAKVRTYGETREVVYDKTYDQLQLSFYVDNNFLVKHVFDKWINTIYDPVTRHVNYADLYTSDKIKIYIEDTEDKKRYAVTLHEVYPKTIAPIQLAQSSNDIIKLNVTLVYKYATYENYDTPGRPNKNIIERINGAFSGIQQGGISGAIGELSNFDYGFTNPIPDSYFNSFRDFQKTASNTLSSLFDNNPPTYVYGSSEGE